MRRAAAQAPFYRVLIHDALGRLRRDSGWIRSRSFVKNYLVHVECAFKDLDTAGAVDTGGVARTLQRPTGGTAPFMKTNAADNIGYMGIQVGTGTTTPTNTSYSLAALIAHGVGAGQLDYGATSFTATAVVGSNVDMVISRTMYNGSGGTITVNEIGVVGQSIDNVGGTRYLLLILDVLASGQPVLDTETITVQYTLRTTV